MRWKNRSLNRHTAAIFVIHPMAEIIGETAAMNDQLRI
jgi:hypothetical protein